MSIGYRLFLTSPGQDDFLLSTCSNKFVTFIFSLTEMFCSFRYVIFNILLSIFVLLLACSLLRWWLYLLPSRMPLLEVRTNSPLVSLCMFQCYPWKCRSAGEYCPSDRDSYLNIIVFVLLPISVPCRCSFQRSRSECCWHILVCSFPSSPLSLTCSSSEPDFHFRQLIPVPFVALHMV